MAPKKPLMLLILDGWGLAPAGPDNAISVGNTPTWDRLLQTCSHSTIETSGLAVGLPEGQMGNSEVGHMNLGAGRVVYQDFTRITQQVESGELLDHPVLVDSLASSSGTVHIMGLWSEGGVHSHQSHLLALIDAAEKHGAKKIVVHAFTDGRDTPPRSAEPALAELDQLVEQRSKLRMGSVSGRYYAMDRDQRWKRVERAWNAIVHAQCEHSASTAVAALEQAYQGGDNDEFVPPTLVDGGCKVADGDVVWFGNFRADRARQLTRAFVEPDFDGFNRGDVPKLHQFVAMTEYQQGLPVAVAFPSEDLTHTLSDVLAENGLTQLRIAETEKYAHVTFFFSGGREKPQSGESRKLVPSPSVATYDLQPEMSVDTLGDQLVESIGSEQFDVIVCNIANPDMVGHTGKLDPAIAAVEAVDRTLGRICEAIENADGELLITADHGNIEQMVDPDTGGAHTAHTTNPVPLVLFGRNAELASGALCDIAPTMLMMLGIDAPPEMTGKALIKQGNSG